MESFVVTSAPKDALVFIPVFCLRHPPLLNRGRNTLFDNVIAAEGPEIPELTCKTSTHNYLQANDSVQPKTFGGSDGCTKNFH